MTVSAGAAGFLVDEYCLRVGYTGPRVPTSETLANLIALQPAAIPFEAIDVSVGKEVDLSLEATYSPSARESKVKRRASFPPRQVARVLSLPLVRMRCCTSGIT